MAFEISSNAFEHGEEIPSKYTCDGENISPPLRWSGVPEQAKSLVLIFDDPDSDMTNPFGHWVLFDIPPDVTEIPEDYASQKNTLTWDAKEGYNSFVEKGYGGPCPKEGKHRYFFRLYAVDLPTIFEELDLDEDMNRDQVTFTIQDHILEKAELMGRYKRK